MKNQRVNRKILISRNDPRQCHLLDPWEHLGTKRRKLLENSWAGLFRQEILAELPVDQIAPWFRADLGRPSKELYTVLGVLVLQQMHDHTDAETVNQLAFNQQWHYALNITEEGDAAKYLCPKTLWSMRKQVTDQELDTVLFDQVTEKLARAFQVDTSKQRLDSVHIKSNMRRLGRLGLVAGCLRRFLVNLKPRYPELYAGLEPELAARYLGKQASACFSQVKPSESAQKLTSVCQEAFLLAERFQGHPEVARMLSYRMLHRVLHEQCEVKPAAESGPEEITVKPAREISSKSLQNPAHPEAGYSAHKGQGYQVQVMETYCASEDPQVKARTLHLITHVAVAPAYESDTQALLPALKDTQARELGPEEVLADTPYGSDDNCQQAAALLVAVISPVGGPPPGAGLSLADFQMSPEGLVLACPQGEAPLATHCRKHRYRAAFASPSCHACPQRSRCPVKPGKHYHYLRYDEKASRLAQRRAHQQTMEFRDRYRWRAGIEGTMSAYDRLTGVKRLRVRGLKAVRFCASLKAVGVNLFRATAVRRASNRAAVTGPGPKSRLAQLIFLVKEQMQAFGTAIANFFIPGVSCYPFELKMAA